MRFCPSCISLKPADKFYDGEDTCKDCRKIINTRNNPRNNHVKRWARLLSGTTQQDLFKLPKDQRAKWFALARDLVASGSTFASASTAETQRTDGVLYIIKHPQLTGLKIGRAFDADSRLNNYQTGCPQRAYKLVAVSRYIDDCVAAEAEVHELLKPFRLKGEWFMVTQTRAKEVISSVTSFR